MANPNKSNGYEDVASVFVAGRGRNSSGVGASVVADWSKTLPSGATVLDLGCGTGVPISQALIERGFKVYGVDASPTIVAAFRARFPELIMKVAGVLQSGGRLLFTAPNESGSFPPDVITGRPQFSLGYEKYRKALETEGMSLDGTHHDEGENHDYFAQKM